MSRDENVETSDFDGADKIFLGIKREGEKIDSFKVASTIEELKGYIDKTKKNDEDVKDKINDSPLIERYITSNHVDRRMIHFVGIYLAGSGAKEIYAVLDDVIKDVKSDNNIDSYEIYEVTELAFSPVSKKIIDLHDLSRGISTIPGALLLAFTAKFDGFLADFIRDAIRSSEAPLATSEKRLSPREVLSAPNLDVLKDQLINEEVEKILRDSHADQGGHVNKVCGFDPFDRYERAASYLEIFERRNLVAHGIPTYNASYFKNLKKYEPFEDAPKPGDKVDIHPTYLRKSLDILGEFAVLLNFNHKRKLKQPLNDAFDEVNKISLEALRRGRSRLANWLAAQMYEFKSDQISEFSRKTNIVYYAAALRAEDKEAEAKELLAKFDWSASSDEFRAQVAALRGEDDILDKLVPALATSGKLTFKSISESPVYRWARKSDKFNNLVENCFGKRFSSKTS